MFCTIVTHDELKIRLYDIINSCLVNKNGTKNIHIYE